MHKPKTSSFHEGSMEYENASLKIRNNLLEDALSKVVRTPGHTRNPSAPGRIVVEVPSIPSVPHPSNAELLAKLYNTNRALEQSITKLNSVSEDLKAKEDKLLKAENELKSRKKEVTELRELVHNFKKLTKFQKSDDQVSKHLQIKLQQTVQYNEQLFADYQKIMRQNQQHQCQLLEQQEEILYLKETLKVNEAALQKALAKTENKVQNLELDLDRIENQQNQSIPELSKKLRFVQNQHKEDIEIIECCQEYINSQFLKTISSLKRMNNQFNCSGLTRFSIRPIHFKGLNDVLNMNSSKNLLGLIPKLNSSNLVQQYTENLISFAIMYVQDVVYQPIEEKFYSLERKFQQFQGRVMKVLTKQQKRLKKQSQNNSILMNQSTFLQSQIGHSVRKHSISFDKENIMMKANQSNNDDMEDRMLEILDVSLRKIETSHQTVEKSFRTFKSLLVNPGNFNNEQKKLYDLISSQAQNNDLLTMYLKKELNILKQELSYFMKSCRSAQMPKLI